MPSRRYCTTVKRGCWWPREGSCSITISRRGTRVLSSLKSSGGIAVDGISSSEGDHLGDSLAANSHQEEPWIKARQHDKKNEVITAESMLDYYSLIQADPSLHPQTKVPNLSDVSTRTFISEEEAEWIKTLLKREA